MQKRSLCELKKKDKKERNVGKNMIRNQLDESKPKKL